MILGPLELFIVTVPVLGQPLLSVTVTVYVAAASEFAVAPVVALLHEYVKTPVPPLADAIALPLLLPHVAFVGVVVTVLIAGGIVIATVLVTAQALASFTVTVYVAVVSPETVCPVALLLQL